MKEYKGSGLTPLFYSEISSSYMLYDIFKNQVQVPVRLIKEFFGLFPEKINVDRERTYPRKGSVDVFIEFINEGKKHALLIEVKVHDYLSATEGQIGTYYNAAVEDGIYDEVYFIYLTQFTEEKDFKGIAVPGTIDEAKKGKELIKEKFLHISWEQMHVFLEGCHELLTEEQQLIVSLNRQWILQQCKTDLENNKVDVGERGLEDYFSDVKTDIRSSLPFGHEVSENKRLIWRIDMSELNEKQFEAILDVIKIYSESNAVNKMKRYKTEESTLMGAKDFLMQISQSVEEWKLLPFYSKLFLIAENTDHLKFYGTGTKGFSIKLEIPGKGEISLCTIYRNKIIDFSIKR